MKRTINFKVDKHHIDLEENKKKLTIDLVPTTKLTICDVSLKVKTEDSVVAQDELGFGLDLGDIVEFTVSRIQKQLKIAPTKEDVEKTTPEPIEKKRGRPRKVKE